MGQDQHQLDLALEEEIERLDLVICRAWRLLSSLCCLGGLLVYLILDMRMAAWLALGAAVLVVWFAVEERARDRETRPRWLAPANAVVESLMPWAFLAMITVTQSAHYALGSWVPPLLFTALVVASTARLKPVLPLLLAGSGSVAFLVLYFALIRGRLTPAEAAEPLFTPAMQVMRSISLLAGGALASLVSRHLRAALLRAHSVVRERDLFGKYRLGERIGYGGMGAVYLATYCPEGGFERPVAIKQIHDHLAGDKSLVDAFRQEAELSARLVHPNIVQVLDFGRIGERYFLALEYVEGITLAKLVQRARSEGEPLDPTLVAYITREILAGLTYSHAGARNADGELLRVVHRDLCPANVLLSKNGEVKIADFGVARALKDAASASTTSVVGHVAYLSPEQARANPVDERSDLFSLGAMVWEMLCGRSLFHRGGEAPTLLAVAHAEVESPSSVRASLAPSWDRLVLAALERDVDRRAGSARALLALLDEIDDAHPHDDMVRHLAAIVRRPPSAEAGEMPDSPTRDLSDDAVTRALV